MASIEPNIRHRSKYLRRIPPAKVLRTKLENLEEEVRQIRELLDVAERIESVATKETNHG